MCERESERDVYVCVSERCVCVCVIEREMVCV